MPYIDPILKQEAHELMSECEFNTGLFASMIFPNRFRLAFSDIHRQIFAALDDESIKKLMIIAPRGIGKTSIVQLAVPAKRILFHQSNYIVSVSHSADHAVLQMESLKAALLSNPMIVKLWGEMKGDNFTKEHWQTSNGVMVLPRGAGQQIRGSISGDYRPDLIIVDDYEDKDEVMSEDNRAKTKRRFYEDIMNAVDEAEPWRLVVIGSMLHQDSLLSNIQTQTDKEIADGKKPTWKVLNLSLCDEQLHSYWPEKYSDEWIASKCDELEAQGLLDSFAMEFMGKVVSDKTNFTKELMQRYDDDKLTGEERARLASIVLIDPAKTTKLGNCSYAVVCWGVDREGDRYLLRDIEVGHYTPDQLHNVAFAMARRNGAHVIGIEVTSLEDHIMYPIKNEMIRRGLHFEFLELRARGSKEERTRLSLLPLYRRKLVYHNTRIAHKIEMSLLSFPKCSEWDVIDAASYLAPALEIGEKYLQRAGMKTREREEAALERLRREDRMSDRPLRRVNVA